MNKINSASIKNEIFEMQVKQNEQVNEFANVKKTEVVKTVKSYNHFAILSIALTFSLTAACLALNHFHLISNN